MNKKEKSDELIVAKVEIAKLAAELVIADIEKTKRSAESIIADSEKVKRSDELIIAIVDKAKLATELVMVNIEKAKLAAELVVIKKKRAFQEKEKQKRENELEIANVEKAKRAAKLEIANVEKAKRATELVIANKELVLAKEKAKQVKELLSINKELTLQITKRKQSEKNIKESNDKFLNLANSISSYVAYVNANTLRYEFVNNLYEESFGIPREKIIGSHIKDVLGESNYQFALKYIKIVKSGEVISYENIFNLTSGKRWLKVNYSPVFDYKNKVVGIALVSHDITDLKQTEKYLLESEERFQLLFNKAPLGYQSLDFDGNFIEVNQQWLDTLGYTKNEVLGKWFGDFLSPAYQDGFRNRFPIFKAQGKIHSEFEMVHKNGNRLFISFEGRVGYDKDGEFIQTHCILQDITEVKRSQEETIRQKELLQKVFDNLPVMITYFDKNGKILLTNHELERILGWTEEEWKTENILAKCYPDPEYLKELLDFMNSGNTGWKDLKTFTKYGTIIDTSWTNISLYDGLSMGIGQDISKRKQEEENLRLSEKRFRAIFEESPLGIAVIDSFAGHIYEVNPMFAKIVGRTVEQMVSIDWMSITHPDDLQEDLDNMAQLNSGKISGFQMEKRYLKPDGSIVWIQMTIAPISHVESNSPQHLCMINDITERKQYEEALKHSFVFSETLLKTIPFGMHIVSETGTVLFQNDNFKEVFGESVIGKKCWDLYRDDKKQCNDCPLIKGITLGETEPYVSNGVLGNRIFEIIHTGMMYEGKKAMLEIFQDITERVQAEEKVQKNENYLKETQIIANLGTYTLDVKSGRWTSSELLDRIFGIDADYDKSVEGWASLIHPTWQKTMTDYFINKVIGNKTKFDKEYKIIRKNDKAERWVQGFGNLIFNENDQPITMIGTIQDITERKEIEKKLRRSEHELQKAQQITHIGSWYLDLATNEVTWTEELYKMYGFDPTLPVPPYTEHMKLFTPESWEILSSSLENTRVSGVPYELKLQTVRKDGNNGWMWVRGEAQTDLKGNTVSLWGAAQDISEHKERERQLEEALEKAQESDRLKSAFLANMSHEIRTPMNGILGFAELLKEPNLTVEEQKDFIQTIQISGARMLNTINNIVDVSKLESGMMKVDINETNLNEKLEFTYKFFRPEVKSKGLKFLLSNGLPLKEALIETDNEKVYGILTNLIKNAIKFTYEGSIEFGYVLKSDSEPAELEFFVKDTGVGIPENQKGLIFERFRQGSGSLSRMYEGSGLGLSICKSYVEMLGGRIWVESKEGNGSTFYFTIPYNPVLQETSAIENVVYAENKEVQVKKLKILIVEDDEISYSLLTRIVQKISKEVLHAVTGIEAVEACRNNPDFDLVLMDIRMPQMNGLEATQQIRQFNKDVIIIAQTAYGFSSDCEKALEAGCNDYITKPIDKNLLYELIKKHFIN